MQYKTLFIAAVLTLFLGSTAAQTVLSSNVTGTEWVEVNDTVLQRIEFSPRTDWAYVEVGRMENPQLRNFQVYRGYSVDVEGDLHRSRIEFSAEEWMNGNNFSLEDMTVFSGSELRYSGVQRTERGMSSGVQLGDKIFIGGTDRIWNATFTARSSESCGLHHVSGENLTAVEECTIQEPEETSEGDVQRSPDNSSVTDSISKNLEDAGKSDILLVGGALLAVLTLILLILYMRHGNSDVREIEKITDEIIEKMESGEMEKDERLLKDLEEANELAYNSEYEKANEKIEQVLNELEGLE